MNKRITVGQIIRTVGIHGEVKVSAFTPDPKRFKKIKQIFLDTGSLLTIDQVRYQNGFVNITFREIQTQEDAQKLVKHFLEVDPKDRIHLPKGNYFISDLIGMTVQSVDHRVLGQLVDVLENVNHDVYVVKNPQREFLIPALKSIILKIDLEKNVMTISPMDGLLD